MIVMRRIRRKIRPYVNKILLICAVLLLIGTISVVYIGKRNSAAEAKLLIEFNEAGRK
jgi:hypothetical protein